jgi:Transposase DDE domain
VAVDIKKKKIISLEVTSEEVHDNKMLKKIVDNASKNNDVKRVLADGTYNSKKNFQYLYDNNIEAAIKVRKNSTGRSMGCYPRKIAVLQQLKDFNKWKASVSYGYRWIAETVVFSSFKRMFGEYVSARRFPNMANELILKASLYNMFTAIKA